MTDYAHGREILPSTIEDADERGDWLHEQRRDKRLDRITELEAENARLVKRVADLEHLVVALAEKEGE